ncbi:MAG: sugar ABC transporter substrate-binding protein [Limnochordales bacterium]|nr:sugar ABC transporter substrate-binding protein [Limnochordales bacterium]
MRVQRSSVARFLRSVIGCGLVLSVALLIVVSGPVHWLAGTADAAGTGKVTIRYMFWGGQTEIDIVQQLVREFMEKYPNIEVKLENIPYPEYPTKVPTLLASGTAPQVMNIPVQMFHSLAAQGAFQDLGSLAAADRSFDLEEYIPAGRKVFTANGKLGALPREFGPMMVFYNKQMFDQKGLPYPDPDWTWDTFVQIGKKLTEDINNDGKIDRFAFAGTSWINHYLPFLWAGGGDIVDSTGKKAVIDQPGAVKGLQFYVDLMLKYHINPTVQELQAGAINTTEWFTTGKIAMYPTFRVGTTVFLKTKGFEFDVVPFPKGPAGYATLVEPVGLAITADTKGKELEAAWQFVKWATGPEGVRLMTEQNLIVPAIVSVTRSSAFLNPNIPPEHDIYFVQMQPYSHIVPPIPQWPTLSSIITSEMAPVFAGQAQVSNAVVKMAERINEVLKK